MRFLSLLCQQGVNKAWNKQYRIAVCNVKYTYCDKKLQGYLQPKKKKKIVLKIKYYPWFI
jgi:hypothetical protein